MKLPKLLFSVFVLLLFISFKSFAQDEMTPPKPVENKVYDAMVGDWVGESMMMGMKMKMEVSVHWDLNHQFLFFNLTSTSTDDPKMAYKGLGIYGVDKNGNAVAWWFDDWGADAVATGTGTFGDNSLHVISSNPNYKDDRTFEMKGGEIVMSASMTMNMGGKEMTMNENITFKKK